MLQVINSMEDLEKGIKVNKVAVIDCHATWCGPCRVIAPYFQRYSEQFSHIAFFKLDVDQVPSVAAALGVRSMPTFIFFEGGERVDQLIGANWKALEGRLKQFPEPQEVEPEVEEPKAGEPGAEKTE